ncbi:hypothetical protein, partial [Oceanivirga salmonicida]|uniref:hypothetical protein n=1 Tax=Oceanivirga salmonicida TaxID=1769291 RepID=UPI001E32ACD9
STERPPLEKDFLQNIFRIKKAKITRNEAQKVAQSCDFKKWLKAVILKNGSNDMEFYKTLFYNLLNNICN